MEYKSYVGMAEVDADGGLIHGEVINTRDVITFQATTMRDLETAFRDSVDDDLAFCATRGEAPDKPFFGRFVLRLSPDVHRKAFIAARRARTSLNAWAAEVLSRATGCDERDRGAPDCPIMTRTPTSPVGSPSSPSATLPM